MTKTLNFLRKALPAGLILAFCLVCAHAQAQGSREWVTINDNILVKEEKPFKFIGANAVNLVFYDDWGLDARKAIVTAKENNLNVLRLYLNWGWGKPEDFDEIIASASDNGIYLILVLTDCCCSRDYTDSQTYFQVHAPFCDVNNIQSRNAFKSKIKQILLRENPRTKRLYRDEPVILAWEIANELEYWRFQEAEVRAWVEDIGGYIKNLDRRHLLTIGINTSNLDQLSSQGLSGMFACPKIDFYSFHFYPAPAQGELSKEEIQVNNRKISELTAKFLALDKPVVMAELGLSDSIKWNQKLRDNPEAAGLYALVLKEYTDQAFRAGCSGVMFWGWGIPEASLVPMWWSKEDHSVVNKRFCDFLKNYTIPSVR